MRTGSLEQEDAADEVVGFHLEQAYRYRTELAPTDRRAKQLASDAGTALGRAGMREWKRSDVAATINLLGRATTLLPQGSRRSELLCELGIAFISSGQTEDAEAALNSAERTEQRGIQLWVLDGARAPSAEYEPYCDGHGALWNSPRRPFPPSRQSPTIVRSGALGSSQASFREEFEDVIRSG